MRRETFEPRTATYSNQIRRFGSRFGEKEIFSWVDQALDGFFELEAGVLTGSLNVLTVGSHRNDAMNIAQLNVNSWNRAAVLIAHPTLRTKNCP